MTTVARVIVSSRAKVGVAVNSRCQLTADSSTEVASDLRCYNRAGLQRVAVPGSEFAQPMWVSKLYVYVLKNRDKPPRYYTGLTSNIAARIRGHNDGEYTHTAKHRPWSVDVVIEFGDERRAVAFERYLKSGSGVAFAQRHLR